MNRSTYTLRRLLALVIALVMFAALFTACEKAPADETKSTEPSETIGQTDAPTDAPTEEPTEEPTEAPTDPVVTVPPVTTGTVNADNLNVRTEPDTTADILKRLAINSTVEILEQKIIDGVNWGRIAEGWINLNYVTIDGGTSTEPTKPSGGNTSVDNDNNINSGTTTDGANATVTADGLNIRKSANADSDKVGSYVKGDRIIVLEKSGNWGKTALGWINLKYVKLDGTVSESTSGSGTSTGTSSNTGKDSTVVSDGKSTILGYGTVVNTTSLAIRTGPGTKYEMVSYLRPGDTVAYYQKSGKWVRMSKGWISSKYLDLGSAVTDGSKGTVTSGLNIRKEASSSSDKVGEYKKGDEVTILETKGNWGRTDKGWISLNYVSFASGTTTVPEAPPATTYKPGTYTVTATSLNIRKDHNSTSADLGSYTKGDKVEITEVWGNWGKTDKGWVSMSYLKSEAKDTENKVGTNTTYKTGTATVLVNTTLTIRKEPDTKADDLGAYKNGDKVEILEVKESWGKTDKGWISLNYVIYE